jgi:hypothetical protein
LFSLFDAVDASSILLKDHFSPPTSCSIRPDSLDSRITVERTPGNAVKASPSRRFNADDNPASIVAPGGY